MELQDFKTKFLRSWVQFVLLNEEGDLLETCNTLFRFPDLPGNLYDQIPFLESISDLLSDLKTGEEISFPCINVDFSGFQGYCDYVFHKINDAGQSRVLWIIMNFSDHYTNLIDLQQQRNESVIQKELLEIEKRNAMLAGELLRFKNEELKRVQKLKTEFFSKVSHEIRTPINGILGIAKLLLGQDDPRMVREYAQIIFETSKHLTSIVNDVLDLSKIEADKIKFEKVRFDIRAVVDAVISAFVYLGKEKGIEVVGHIDKNVPGFLTGDQVRLSQILYNLLSNSFKFTSHGRVSLKVSVHARHDKGPEIKFTVKDTGIGISAKNLDRIFEPYEQAGANIEENHGGTGLGLYIVKQLIEQQNGSMQVSSKPGTGTTFTFILPFDIAGDSPLVSDRLQRAVTKKLKILVGEDNPLNQRILAEFIEKWGFEAEIVENGREIIKKLRQPGFDLMILDYKMPEMDGLRTLQYMRSNFGSEINAMPVILFTGEHHESVLSQFGHLGVKAVLKKPIDPNALLEEIERLCCETDAGEHFNLTYAIEMTSGNRKLISDMIDIFIDTMPGELKKMRDLAVHMDYTGLSKTLHKVKPNFHYMGIGKAESVFDLLEKELTTTHTNEHIVAGIDTLQVMVEGAIKMLKVEKMNWVG